MKPKIIPHPNIPYKNHFKIFSSIINLQVVIFYVLPEFQLHWRLISPLRESTPTSRTLRQVRRWMQRNTREEPAVPHWKLPRKQSAWSAMRYPDWVSLFISFQIYQKQPYKYNIYKENNRSSQHQISDEIPERNCKHQPPDQENSSQKQKPETKFIFHKISFYLRSKKL